MLILLVLSTDIIRCTVLNYHVDTWHRNFQTEKRIMEQGYQRTATRGDGGVVVNLASYKLGDPGFPSSRTVVSIFHYSYRYYTCKRRISRDFGYSCAFIVASSVARPKDRCVKQFNAFIAFFVSLFRSPEVLMFLLSFLISTIYWFRCSSVNKSYRCSW